MVQFNKEEIQQKREEENNYFSKFKDKKVIIITDSTNDFINVKRELKGRILQKGDGDYCFLPKGHKNRAKDITLGLFDGFLATLTIKEIKEGW